MDKESTNFKAIYFLVMCLIGSFLFVSIGSISFLELMGLPLEKVRPWSAYLYYEAYGDLSRVRKSLLVAHTLSGFVIGLFVLLFLKPKALSLFGDAKWAREADLKKAVPPLRAKEGIILGKFNGKYIIQGGQQFAIMAAPTRSMKGVGIVIPNCLNWGESLVVTDIKLENFAITSGYRAEMGQAVYLFNPAARDYKTHCWNPLSYISSDKNFRVDDIQKIATFLIPSPPGVDPMWSSAGRSLFLGIVLYLFDSDEYLTTLGEVYRQLSTKTGSKEYFESILESKANILDPLCVMSLSKFVHLPDKQREGVKSTLETAITLWANPLLDSATSKNDFDFRDLRKKKMTIYVGVTPDNLKRMAPVLNLFFQQLVDQNTKAIPDKKIEPYSVLLLMDEFPSLGKMETISKGVSYMAGYNLRLLPIVQSPAQIKEIYGPEATDNFIENHATRVVYAPKNINHAREIAEELGNLTVKSMSTSKPKEMGKGQGSTSTSKARRQLLLPQEVKAIGQGAEIILSENCPPIMARKIIYYQDDNFLRRCVKKERLKMARKCKSQEDFMQNVKPVAIIPTVKVKPQEIRGETISLNPSESMEFDIAYKAITLPDNQGEPLTEEQISIAADNFMTMLEET